MWFIFGTKENFWEFTFIIYFYYRQSQLYKKVWALERPNTEKYQLLFEVLHQLSGYSLKGQTLTLLDLAIIDAQKKIKSRSEKE